MQENADNRNADIMTDRAILEIKMALEKNSLTNYCLSTPKLDTNGYDLVLDLSGKIWLVQIKTKKVNGKTNIWKIEKNFVKRPESVIVVIEYSKDYLIKSILASIPATNGIIDYKVVKQTRANSKGIKNERLNMIQYGKKLLTRYESMEEFIVGLLVPTTKRIEVLTQIRNANNASWTSIQKAIDICQNRKDTFGATQENVKAKARSIVKNTMKKLNIDINELERLVKIIKEK